jgi:hypothetical protein
MVASAVAHRRRERDVPEYPEWKTPRQFLGNIEELLVLALVRYYIAVLPEKFDVLQTSGADIVFRRYAELPAMVARILIGRCEFGFIFVAVTLQIVGVLDLCQQRPAYFSEIGSGRK